jgi:hypothetical protein
MSEDFISQLSVVQAMDEARDAGSTEFETQYFSDFDKAKEWLFSV